LVGCKAPQEHSHHDILDVSSDAQSTSFFFLFIDITNDFIALCSRRLFAQFDSANDIPRSQSIKKANQSNRPSNPTSQ
jgi:hypothetical protein